MMRPSRKFYIFISISVLISLFAPWASAFIDTNNACCGKCTARDAQAEENSKTLLSGNDCCAMAFDCRCTFEKENTQTHQAVTVFSGRVTCDNPSKTAAFAAAGEGSGSTRQRAAGCGDASARPPDSGLLYLAKQALRC